MFFVFIGVVALADAESPLSGFLPAREWAPASSWEVRGAGLEDTILWELEKELGREHRLATEARHAKTEEDLHPTFEAVPRNVYGNLGHSAVRYTLHRHFLQKHGWFVRGLEPKGRAWNASSPVEMLRGHVPQYVLGLFERRLGGRGFGLHEMAVLADTLETLVHFESTARLKHAWLFHLHSAEPSQTVPTPVADDVLSTYMASYIMGGDLANFTRREVLLMKEHIASAYPTWPATQDWIREMRQKTIQGQRLTFDEMVKVVEHIGDEYGRFQDKECNDLKGKLVALEEKGTTGCVRLTDFYRSALDDGNWQFAEAPNYLWQLGALENSVTSNPHVIVPNYIYGPSNCVASSKYYLVCCRDACEDLLQHLVRELRAPSAEPLDIVAALDSATFLGGHRPISAPLRGRLGEVAEFHSGRVPLHGRLFAQWMHHAYPRMCPYPHISGTKKPRWMMDWEEETGERSDMPAPKMRAFLNTAAPQNVTARSDGGTCVQWQQEEELVVPSTVPPATEDDSHMWLAAGSVALLTVTASLMIFLMRACRTPPPDVRPTQQV